VNACASCGYSLAGLHPRAASECPECGAVIPWGRRVLPGTPRWAWIAAVVLAAAGQFLPVWAVFTEDWGEHDLPGGGMRAMLSLFLSPLLSIPATIAAGYVIVRFGPPRRFTVSLWVRIVLGGAAAAVGLTLIGLVLCAPIVAAM
jgi:hypothetical protein